MSNDTKMSRQPATGSRWVAVAVLLAVAFAASYAYAVSSRGAASAPVSAIAAQVPAGSTGKTAPCACCSSGGATTQQTTVAGATTVIGGVQKVSIDLTTGSYSPNYITAKAGVPVELDFKGPASSCNGYVQSQQLGFSQDVSNGGTIKLAALQPGTYTWACGMNMYTGRIVVK